MFHPDLQNSDSIQYWQYHLRSFGRPQWAHIVYIRIPLMWDDASFTAMHKHIPIAVHRPIDLVIRGIWQGNLYLVGNPDPLFWRGTKLLRFSGAKKYMSALSFLIFCSVITQSVCAHYHVIYCPPGTRPCYCDPPYWIHTSGPKRIQWEGFHSAGTLDRTLDTGNVDIII